MGRSTLIEASTDRRVCTSDTGVSPPLDRDAVARLLLTFAGSMKKTPNDPKRDRRLRTKMDQLEDVRSFNDGTTFLTTDQGVPILHTDDSLKGGPRGPSLLEDFHLREKRPSSSPRSWCRCGGSAS